MRGITVGMEAASTSSAASCVARVALDVEHGGDGAEACGGVVLQVHVEAAVEEGLPFRMIDQVARRRDADAAVLAGEEEPKRPRLPAAVDRVEAQRRRRPSTPA